MDIINYNTTPSIDHNMLKQLNNMVGHNTTVLLIQQFLTYALQQLTALQQSLAIGDAETLRHQAHQFRGESLQMGANQLGAICERLETLAQQGQLDAAPTNLAKLKIELSRVQAAFTQVSRYD
ncbi:Hpt domain-containing protein [Candidatus Parabeggiatoa sp. HSG14]|uniref:Hpt domain-containing protein n=1 Tax=Candidatus Parabeggiatoa sp. HSG14 TaxID=3055593 RepID=UPI0025A78B57|nr:Hpt domain-containing protein [Thiotrichales bacterium HSG14]